MTKKKKHIGWWIIILVVIILLLILLKVGGCLGGTNGLKVTLDTVSERSIVQTVDASGKIYPETEVRIKADVSGEIVALPVQEGDSVVKGQLLMKIDPVIYKTEVTQAEAEMDKATAALNNAQQMANQAKAQYKKAQSDFLRNQKLYNDKVISASEFEQFKSSYLAAKAAYEAAKAQVAGSRYGMDGAQAALKQSRESLNKTVILSPTSGIVSQMLVKDGERVVGTQQMDGTQLMTIADLSKMEVRVNISENDITKVVLGDTGIITVDAYPNEKFKGIVSKIAVSSVALNNNTGSLATTNNDVNQVTNYTVHVLILPGAENELRQKRKSMKFLFKPGMTASVSIRTQKVNKAVSVPINAVTTRALLLKDSTTADSANQANGLSELPTVVFVYDAATGEVHTKKVKTGIQDNEYIQILSGLKPGEKVVVAPFSAIARVLDDGTKVSPVPKNKLYESEVNE